MKRDMNVFILGPAGSGKSLLAGSFASYLEGEGYRVKLVNLDPGVLELSYKADFDVRVRFTVEGIMREKGLGPNGAILEAMERLAEVRLPRLDADYVLYDTPGQLEPFLFRDAGRKIVGSLEDCCCLFLGDLSAPRRNLLGFYLYALTARYTLEAETLAVLNKVDLLSREEAGEVRRLMENPASLLETSASLRDEMNMEILKALRSFFPPQRVPLVSAKTGLGFDELLTLLFEVKCACGDLT
jgi:hypothetical protein